MHKLINNLILFIDISLKLLYSTHARKVFLKKYHLHFYFKMFQKFVFLFSLAFSFLPFSQHNYFDNLPQTRDPFLFQQSYGPFSFSNCKQQNYERRGIIFTRWRWELLRVKACKHETMFILLACKEFLINRKCTLASKRCPNTILEPYFISKLGPRG